MAAVCISTEQPIQGLRELEITMVFPEWDCDDLATAAWASRPATPWGQPDGQHALTTQAPLSVALARGAGRLCAKRTWHQIPREIPRRSPARIP